MITIPTAAATSALPTLPEADEEEFEAEEGRLLTRLHRQRERNAALVRRKKMRHPGRTARWRVKSAVSTMRPSTVTWERVSSEPPHTAAGRGRVSHHEAD